MKDDLPKVGLIVPPDVTLWSSPAPVESLKSRRNSLQLSSFAIMGSQILKTVQKDYIALLLFPSYTVWDKEDTQKSVSGQISLSCSW